jgi:integrase/recombinase XerD
MNLGEQILSDLVVALIELYPNMKVETTKNKIIYCSIRVLYSKS